MTYGDILKRLLRNSALHTGTCGLDSEHLTNYCARTWTRCEIGYILVLFTNKKWHNIQHCAAVSATAELLFFVVLFR